MADTIKIRDMTDNAAPSSGAMFPLVEPLPDAVAYRATFATIRSGLVPTTRTLNATAPLLCDGGASGDLSANRTLSISAATASTVGTVYGMVYDPRSYGTLGTANDTAVFQAAIDAAFAAGGGVVLNPAGAWNIANLKMKSKVSILGLGRASKFVTIAGATGGTLELYDASTERFFLRDFWIEGNLANATVSGIAFDSTGAVWSGGGTEIFLQNIDITNCAVHGVKLTAATATQLHRVRVRNVTLDGFYVDATDCLLNQCSVSPASRYGVNLQQHVNSLSNMKIGNTTSHGIYVGASSFANVGASLLLDSIGGDGIYIDGKDNALQFSISNPTGNGVTLGAGAQRNVLVGTMANNAGGANMPYAAVLTAGSIDNELLISAKAYTTAAYSGDIDANRLVLDGVEFGLVIPFEHFRGVAGTASEGTTGNRIPTWILGTNGDEIAAATPINPLWRGRKLALSVQYHVATGDATKNIQWTFGLGSLANGAAVTEADVTQSDTISAPATANTTAQHTCTVTLTIGAGDTFLDVTVKRGAATNIVGNLLFHKAWYRIVG